MWLSLRTILFYGIEPLAKLVVVYFDELRALFINYYSTFTWNFHSSRVKLFFGSTDELETQRSFLRALIWHAFFLRTFRVSNLIQNNFFRFGKNLGLLIGRCFSRLIVAKWMPIRDNPPVAKQLLFYSLLLYKRFWGIQKVSIERFLWKAKNRRT